MLHLLLSFIFIVQLAHAALTASAGNIFSSLSIESQNNDNLPLSPWTATLSFDISDTSQFSKGDSFSLELPHVYRMKFQGTDTTLTVSSGGSTVFTCYKTSGAYKYDHSTLSCDIEDGFFDYDTLQGDLSFTVFFGVGGSTTDVDIADAKFFKPGDNVITWGHLNSLINIAVTDFTNDFYTFSHTTDYDSVQTYYLFPGCDSNATQSGSIDLSFGADFPGRGQIVCDSTTQVYMTNDLNAWLFPKSFKDLGVGYNCNEGEISFDYTEIPAGYRVFVAVFQYQDDVALVLENEIAYDLTCSTGKTSSDDFFKEINIATRQASGTATGSISSTTTTVTSTWSNSYTTTTTAPHKVNDRTITVDVNVPYLQQSSSSSASSSSSGISSSSSLSSSEISFSSSFSYSSSSSSSEISSSSEVSSSSSSSSSEISSSSLLLSSSSIISSPSKIFSFTTIAPTGSTITSTICPSCSASSSERSSIVSSSSSVEPVTSSSSSVEPVVSSSSSVEPVVSSSSSVEPVISSSSSVVPVISPSSSEISSFTKISPKESYTISAPSSSAIESSSSKIPSTPASTLTTIGSSPVPGVSNSTENSSSLSISSTTPEEPLLPTTITTTKSRTYYNSTIITSSDNVISTEVPVTTATTETTVESSVVFTTTTQENSSEFPGSVETHQEISLSSASPYIPSSFSTVITSSTAADVPQGTTVTASPEASESTTQPKEDVTTYITTSNDIVITVTTTKFQTDVTSSTSTGVPEAPVTSSISPEESSSTSSPSDSTPTIAIQSSVTPSTSSIPSIQSYEGAASSLKFKSTLLLALYVLFF